MVLYCVVFYRCRTLEPDENREIYKLYMLTVGVVPHIWCMFWSPAASVTCVSPCRWRMALCFRFQDSHAMCSFNMLLSCHSLNLILTYVSLPHLCFCQVLRDWHWLNGDLSWYSEVHHSEGETVCIHQLGSLSLQVPLRCFCSSMPPLYGGNILLHGHVELQGWSIVLFFNPLFFLFHNIATISDSFSFWNFSVCWGIRF